MKNTINIFKSLLISYNIYCKTQYFVAHLESYMIKFISNMQNLYQFQALIIMLTAEIIHIGVFHVNSF